MCLQVVLGCRSLRCSVYDIWAIEKTATKKLQQTHDDVVVSGLRSIASASSFHLLQLSYDCLMNYCQNI